MRKLWIASVAIVTPLFLAPVCEAQSLSTVGKGAIAGGILGAGTGAIIGAAVHHPGAGAAIGGGIGLLGGAAVGNELQNSEAAQRQTQSEIDYQRREIEYQRREIQALQQEQQTE